MTNEEKVKEMFPFYQDMDDVEIVQTTFKRAGAIEMAEWKEKQMIEKACTIYQNELKQFAQLLKIVSGKNTIDLIDIEKSVEEFRKAMEE